MKLPLRGKYSIHVLVFFLPWQRTGISPSIYMLHSFTNVQPLIDKSANWQFLFSIIFLSFMHALQLYYQQLLYHLLCYSHFTYFV
jgi:hypothetical protein